MKTQGNKNQSKVLTESTQSALRQAIFLHNFLSREFLHFHILFRMKTALLVALGFLLVLPLASYQSMNFISIKRELQLFIDEL